MSFFPSAPDLISKVYSFFNHPSFPSPPGEATLHTLIEDAIHSHRKSNKRRPGLPGDSPWLASSLTAVANCSRTIVPGIEPPLVMTTSAALPTWQFISWSSPALQMHSGFALQNTSVELCRILTEAWLTGSANANGLKNGKFNQVLL